MKQETPKEEPNFYEKLVEYFKNTPREKILEDWNKTAECDNIGPTVEEFLSNTEETLKTPIIIVRDDDKELFIRLSNGMYRTQWGILNNSISKTPLESFNKSEFTFYYE